MSFQSGRPTNDKRRSSGAGEVRIALAPVTKGAVNPSRSEGPLVLLRRRQATVAELVDAADLKSVEG